ncbi:hypothetical protein L484_002029 [Morus notabilis]|uniref:Plastocyanin-like domain-containing protein n=1 Tax=Morus notabilis TaxID=981085 RepID=W9R9G2_9ROSA|nr:hypothetical protein L484_002029 [Morus notabilis]
MACLVMEPHGLSSHGARGLSSSWGHINDFKMLMNDFLIKRSCEPVRESIAVSLDRMRRVHPRGQNPKLGPGVWFMHCHFDVHLSWGLRMAWIVLDGELPNQKLPPPPSDLPKC